MKPGFKLKRVFQEMADYSVLQAFDGIKLNQNEASTDVLPELKEEISRRLNRLPWRCYPPGDAEELTAGIADYADFPVKGIMAASGSNELIRTVIYGCCDSGDHIVTVTPTFSIYKRTAAVMNISTSEVPLNDDFSFDPTAVIRRAREVKAKVVILASPNNPTGTVIRREDIPRMAERIDGLLVMDEAYFEFFGETAADYTKNHPNLVVLRTFSKALQAAGVRLGYLMGQPEVVQQLKKVAPPFSVGIFQQTAGDVLLQKDNREWLNRRVRETIEQRQRLHKELSVLPGIQPIPSHANFVLFKSNTYPSHRLYHDLFDYGVLLRYYNTPELANMLRVSVGTPPENRIFLKKIKTILSQEVNP